MDSQVRKTKCRQEQDLTPQGPFCAKGCELSEDSDAPPVGQRAWLCWGPAASCTCVGISEPGSRHAAIHPRAQPLGGGGARSAWCGHSSPEVDSENTTQQKTVPFFFFWPLSYSQAGGSQGLSQLKLAFQEQSCLWGQWEGDGRSADQPWGFSRSHLDAAPAAEGSPGRGPGSRLQSPARLRAVRLLDCRAPVFLTCPTVWRYLCTLPENISCDRLDSYLPTFACFPGGSAGKESACSAADLGAIPGLGRFPWRWEWLSSPMFLPGESHR